MIAGFPSVLDVYAASTTALTRAQIDWLTKRNGVSLLALTVDADGDG